MTFIFKGLTLALILTSLWMPIAWAQSSTGTVRGTVADPSGALVPSAGIILTNENGYSKTVRSGRDGGFEVGSLVPGRYSLSVTAGGFAPLTVNDVLVYGGKVTSEKLTLRILVEEQQVQVSTGGLSVDTSADNNATAIVIKGKDLDALSDDPDQLQNELNALAGPSAGPNGGQIYIDGFTGGQLPPKSSIREIRINQNPFSAQYDKLGYGRIEILTKPGTDKFQGSVLVNGNDSSFNSLNPFITSQPNYYTTFLSGNLSGSLNRSTSWFGSVFQRDNQSNSIINAQRLDGSGASYNYKAAVANPQSRLDLSSRIDLQLTTNNTLSIRYMYDRQKQSNSGVSQFALESQAYDVLDHEHTVQVSDTQVLNANAVNETRFQYTGARDSQVARSADPTITVQGAFTGGGSNEGTVRDNQDRFELQNYTTVAAGKHAINLGLRLRLTHAFSYSTSGFNGNYTYQSLNSYALKAPSQYEITTGATDVRANLFDAGLFFQDDYRARPNLTLSYGLRFEGQNRINDYANWAPRFSLAWAPFSGNGKTPAKTIVRAGYGWFFDRFTTTNLLTAIRQNGVNQKQYVVKNPTFYQNAPPPTQLASSSTVAPTIYQVSPKLKAALNMQLAFGLEHQFGRVATVSGTYIYSRGIHQYLTNNINAFVQGTYDPVSGTGVRPNGLNENIYQFQSGAVYNQNQLMMNYTVRARRISLFGFYMLNFAKADSSGATYFPSTPTNPGADYGRANFDVRNRFLLGGSLQAPFGISLSPMLVANAGSPFNITVGQDLNGDNQFNDRPAFATSTSTKTMQTEYGLFDLSPDANRSRIPYNYGAGPAQLSMNLRVSKSFGIGPRMEGGPRGATGIPGGPGGPGGPPPGGAPGGGLGPGGMSGNGGPPRLDMLAPRRYSLTFGAMGRNVFNNVNLVAPVGVLQSPLFGKSNALAGGFFSSQAANRSIDLQMSFSF
ncbi:TonB-dependent receptor [Terriglobus albidus]|uniref:TonB-dependent receptor n=1 Tax=Terriglobus albidus TaxID=1592106 RepID=UPI0021DF64AC|nr:TonB-dependent receptor [Terriglobus albidus]